MQAVSGVNLCGVKQEFQSKTRKDSDNITEQIPVKTHLYNILSAFNW